MVGRRIHPPIRPPPPPPLPNLPLQGAKAEAETYLRVETDFIRAQSLCHQLTSDRLSKRRIDCEKVRLCLVWQVCFQSVVCIFFCLAGVGGCVVGC